MDRPQTTAFWRGRLPHWEVADGRYFVTIHLAGAVPQDTAERIREMVETLRSSPDNEVVVVQRKVFMEMEKWLDRSVNNQYLAEPLVAKMVCEAIEHRAERGVWNVLEYVVMPNHLHIYLQVINNTLKDTVEKFKKWTGREAGRQVDLHGKQFWQREWFDHWARSADQGERIKRYIRDNPVKAGLVSDFRDWPYGSWGSE